MAVYVKRVAAILVSIVWLSLIVVLLAGFFVPGLREILPPQVREFTDPAALRDRLDILPDILAEGIEGLFPTEPEIIETPAPDPSTPPPATPVPLTPTATLLAPASATPESEPSDVPPASIVVAVIGQADLRSAPSADADVIGLVAAEGTVSVVGRDADGRWYRLEDGTWISADDLVDAPQDRVAIVMAETQQPTAVSVEQPTQAATPVAAPTVQLVGVTAIVNKDANLRSGPGVEFDRVDGVNFGSEVFVVGRSADGEWYLLESETWLFAALVVEAVDVPVVAEDAVPGSLPTVETDAPPPETDAPLPETDAPPPETDAPLPETDAPPLETDAGQPKPVVIAPLGANLRVGPGIGFDRTDGVEQGRVLIIVAQNPGGEWLKLEDGSWIFAALVDNVPLNLPEESEEAGDDDTEGDDSGDDGGIPEETPVPTAEDAPDDTDSNSTQLPDSPADESDAPADEDEPDAPVDEDEPDAPVDEDEPDAPVDEDEPDAPVDEDEPDAPVDEDEPDAPVDEDKPDAPVDEDEPDVQATVNIDANLRDGPGLTATIVGSAVAGTQLTIVGRSDDGLWLELDDGRWIFATLVDIAPVEAEENADADDGADDANAEG